MVDPVDLCAQSGDATSEVEIEHLRFAEGEHRGARSVEFAKFPAHPAKSLLEEFDDTIARETMRFGQRQIELGVFDGMARQDQLEALDEHRAPAFGDRIYGPLRPIALSLDAVDLDEPPWARRSTEWYMVPARNLQRRSSRRSTVVWNIS
ncbi:hypothetical protein GOOTI_093_00350 [Gordonia otitidis NBRC 100426]|uniref:Uncharacterized protein n=1 Tax=Gordonia otitidis (strain DSM 44809 / CCUG 52243 / JCM 12355 / NBRC 100426 / IFM 10032) TaxID=1108044 RepID=H5TKV0_GORO1|nr:hypothetical protein GOOTI_093_00350 [Gordonia otitidis NBRC 100426]